MSKQYDSLSRSRFSADALAASFATPLFIVRSLAFGIAVTLFTILAPAQGHAQSVNITGAVNSPYNMPIEVPDPLPVPWDFTDDLYIGYNVDGTLEIADGAQVTFSQNNSAFIGATGDTGIVTVTGAGSSWAPQTLNLETGMLNIENNAVVTHGGGARVGGVSSTSPTVTVRDGGVWTTSSTLVIGNFAHGILNIGRFGLNDSAGTVNANLITSEYPGVGRINFNQSDHVDFDVPIEGLITVTQRGTGSTTLTATNTYGGTTIVTGGTMLINGSITSTSYVWDGGMLGGTGDLGNVNTSAGGIYAPGNTIGTQTVAGNWNLVNGAIYEVELTDAGNTAGVHNDLVNVLGDATIADGAIIHVTPENGVDDGTTYTPGTIYTILQTDADTGELDVQGSIVVTDDYPNLDFTVSFDDDNVYLTSQAAESEIGTVSLPMLSWPMLWLTAIGLMVLARSRFPR